MQEQNRYSPNPQLPTITHGNPPAVATRELGKTEIDPTVQQRIADINLMQSQINAAFLRDFERQNQLLDYQRKEIASKLAELERKSQEVINQEERVKKAEEDSRVAQQQLDEAKRLVNAATIKENSVSELIRAALEQEIFPGALIVEDTREWRSQLLSLSDGDSRQSNFNLLLSSIYLVKATFEGNEPEELYSALARLGRYIYKFSNSQTAQKLADLLNASSNSRYNIRVAQAGEPTDKTWMNFSGIATVTSVKSWAIIGADKLKHHAADVN